MAPLAYLLGLFTLLGLPRPVGTITVSDFSSAYIRGDFKGAPTQLSADTAPRLGLGYAWRRANITLGYGPRITVYGITGQQAPGAVFTHNIDGTLGFARRRYSVSLSQTFTFGTQFIANLGQLTTPTANPVPPGAAPPQQVVLPASDTLRVRSSQTVGTVSRMLSRRWGASVSGSYIVAGGYGAKAEQVLPRSWTGLVGLSLAYVKSPRTQLTTQLSGSHAEASNGYLSWLGFLQESVGTTWSERTTTRFSGGGSFVHTLMPNGTVRIMIVPTGSATVGFSLNESKTTSLQGTFYAQPLYNAIKGTFALGTTSNLGLVVTEQRYNAAMGAETFQTFRSAPTLRVPPAVT